MEAKNTNTSLQITKLQKEAMEKEAKATLVPVTTQARASLLRAMREHPALAAVRLLHSQGLNSADIPPINLWDERITIALPEEIGEVYEILARLTGTTKSDLYREMIFRYGPKDLQDGYENLREKIMGSVFEKFTKALEITETPEPTQEVNHDPEPEKPE